MLSTWKSRLKYLFIAKEKKGLYKDLKKILGFLPQQTDFYKLAFIHRSASIVQSGQAMNNERLEYLGDAVLGTAVANYLFHYFPDQDEGFLTQMRSKIVNGQHLSRLAQKIGLDKHIVSNTSNSRGKRHLYGDAMEAFIGAAFLDIGFRKTEHFIIERLIKAHVNLEELVHIDTNFKSRLIEWGQRERKTIDFYTDQEPHNPKVFVSYVRINEETFGSGSGRSKKEAEQEAAKESLIMVEEITADD